MPRSQPSQPSHRSPARPRRLLAAGLVVATLALAGAACSDDGTDEAGSASSASREAGDGTTTTTNLLDAHEGPNALGCITRAPGEPLSRDEAIVRFTPEQACPGYVTVIAGTPVTFANEDDAPHTVLVQVMDTTGAAGATVLEEEIPPGDYIEQQFLEPGIFSFTTDALPAFRGTVEVQDADASAT